jgi:spore coat protein A, manganese oxidase
MDDDVRPTRSTGPSRRTVVRTGSAGFGLFLLTRLGGESVAVEVPSQAGMSLPMDSATIPKYAAALLVPPVMPRTALVPSRGGKNIEHYVIAVRQFAQQVLPPSLPATTVWGYGPVDPQFTHLEISNAPSLTIEAEWDRPVRVTWVNGLVDDQGRALPHLLPLDPTLHWANPGGGESGRDSTPTFTEAPGAYTGPVPVVTHVHGAVGVGDESDGYPEAWYLPDAVDIPADYATRGTWYDFFAGKAADLHGVEWGPGRATFQYPNDQRAATLWYHDHTLGITRANVYAGPAGFYLVRGGPDGDDAVRDTRTGRPAVLPGPAPERNDRYPSNRRYREVPLAIQDRSFNADGSLFYPDSREFFDGVTGPYIPAGDVPPVWNPEFFGNAIIVNGTTWPTLEVEQRRYRFRLLNGCNSRFLLLAFGDIPGVQAWQIGSDGGFLAAPVPLTAAGADGRLLLSPAERADVVVDFTQVPTGEHVLRNLGPDEPFGGGEPGVDFDAADPATTGQVMQLRVVPRQGQDRSTPPEFLELPTVTDLPPGSVRRLALVEEMSMEPGLDAPVAALLGTVDDDGLVHPHLWHDEVSENPDVGAVETWEVYNTTEDAHPIHVHEVMFRVLGRQVVSVTEEGMGQLRVVPDGAARGPEAGELGWKDTVIAYPGEVTRIRMRFDSPGQFVWHCHILEHEDNEMMRPYRIGPVQPGQPMGHHEG